MANSYKTVGAKPTTALSTAYTCPPGKTAFVMLARATNVASSTATITVNVYDASAATAYAIVNNLNVPVSASVRIFEDRLVLEAGDYIQVKAGTASTVDFVLSILEQ